MCHKYIESVGGYEYLVHVGGAALHAGWCVVGIVVCGMCYAPIAGAVYGVVIDLVILQAGGEDAVGAVAVAIELHYIHSIDGIA